MATHSCPKCGKPHLTREDAARCCAKGQKCPACNGKGYITGGIFEPNQKCPRCNGSGVI